MSDIDKEKEKLAEELKQARRRITELETALKSDKQTKPLSDDVFRSFAESATDSFTIWDSDRRLIYTNDATLKYFPAGTKKSDLLNKHFTELFPEPMETNQYERYLGTIQPGKALYIEDFVAPQKFGSVRLSIKGFTLGNGLGIIATDITERKRMEDALRESKDRLGAIIENAPDVIFSYDTNGRFISGNKRAEELLGYSNDEMLGKTFAESGIFTSQSLTRASERLAENRKGKQTQPMPFELIAKDGSHIFVEVHSVPIVQGDKLEVIAIARDITERKRMEEKLRQGEEKLRRIFESMGDAITIIDINGKVIDANESAIHMFGGNRGEYIGRHSLELLAERDRARAVKDMMEAFSTGYSDTKEYTILRKDGTEFLSETTSTVLHDASGEPVGLINILRDITERKQMEEKLRQSEEKIRQIFNSVGVGISVTDMEGKVVEVNDFGLRLCGCSKEEMRGQNGIRFIAERDRPRIIKELIKASETGKSGTYEFTSLKKDGTEYETETIVTAMRDSSGKPTGLIVSVTDITERKRIERELNDYKANLERMVQERTADVDKANNDLKQEIAERKRMEEELQRKERYFRALTESSADGIMVLNRDGTIRYESRGCLRILGHTAEERIGHNVFDPIHPDDIQAASDAFTRLMAGASARTELRARHKDGTWHNIEATLSNLLNDPGVEGIVVNLRDVTERRRAEDALRESEQKMRTLFSASPDTIMTIDRQGKILFINRATTKSIEETIGTTVFNYIQPEYQAAYSEAMERVLRTGKPDRIETCGLGPGKRISWYEVRFVALGTDDETRSLMVIGTDITERKQMEEALKESEEKYRSLAEQAAQGLIILQKGRVVFANQAWSQINGYSVEEILAMPAKQILDITHPEDRALVAKTIKHRMQGEPLPARNEWRIIRKDGTVRWIETYAKQILFKGKPADQAIMLDITERKRMEEALRKSEGVLRSLFDATPAGVALLIDRKMQKVNNALSNITGYTREELEGNDVRMLYRSEEEYLKIGRDLYAQMKEEGLGMVEATTNNKNGDVVEVLICLSPCDPNDWLAGVTATVLDITERKRAEAALRDSDRKMHAVFNQNFQLTGLLSIDGILLEANNMALEFIGAEPSSVLNKPFWETPWWSYSPALREKLRQAVRKAAGGESIRFETTHVAKDGMLRYFDFSLKPVMDETGKVLFLIPESHDITERKQIENDLRESEERLRVFFENVPDILFAHNMEGQFTDMNKKALELSGYSRDELVGKNILETGILPPDQIEGVIAGIKGIEDGRSGYPYEVQLVKKNGERMTVEAVSFPMRRKGRLDVMGIARDMTERKRIEEALKESETKYRTLVEQSDQGICILQNGRIVFANKALTKMNGYTLKELYAMSANALSQMIHPDDRKLYADRIKMRLEGKKLRPRHEYRVISKDGTEIWFETFSKRILYKGQPAIQSMMADITERKHWEEKLQQSEDELRFYLRQINMAQEEERKRIARELHDETIQEIVALSRQLDNLIDKRLGPEEERRENRKQLEEAQQKVNTILKGIRHFTRDLRPSILDDLGLVPALEWLVSDISDQFKIPIKLSFQGKEKHIASDEALATFRIAQESLRNACRHAGATHIRVDLKYSSQKMTLRITDNGQGFDLPEDTASLIRRGKLGVAGMYERARLIGANLSIKSKSNKGTTVTLEVNIK